MRFLGIALLSVSVAMLGVCGSQRLKGREKELRGFIAGLEVIKAELGHYLMPLPELLERAAANTSGGVSAFFKCCADKSALINGEPFRQLWEESLEESRLNLRGTDLSVLGQLGGILGRYDAEEQIAVMNHVLAQLEEQRIQAGEQSGRLGELYTVLGLTVGALIMIIMV